jgi:hypothetical protein
MMLSNVCSPSSNTFIFADIEVGEIECMVVHGTAALCAMQASPTNTALFS